MTALTFLKINLHNNSVGNEGAQAIGDVFEEAPACSHIFAKWERIRTQHFNKRINCRDITEEEIDLVLETGMIHKYFPDHTNKKDQLEPKFNILAETHLGREILISFTVPTNGEKRIVLLTAYAKGEKDNCK